jgi:hypothetical protein
MIEAAERRGGKGRMRPGKLNKVRRFYSLHLKSTNKGGWGENEAPIGDKSVVAIF